MRTEARKEPVVIKVPTSAEYQYDDSELVDGPHVYQWRGVTASGATKMTALAALGVKIGEAMNIRIS